MEEGHTLQDYTELIIERDRLAKEAEQYHISYVKHFGALIEKCFSLKIECIRCKKMISEFLKLMNRGVPPESVSLDDLKLMVRGEMESYESQLKSISAMRKIEGTVTAYELAQIKKIYHKIATRIHPDINPQLFGHEEVKQLWEDVSLAYKGNDLDRMKELEAVAASVIGKYCDDVVAVVIGDIEDKIRKVKDQIETIKSTDPYQYKYLLDDEELCAETEKRLQGEIDNYLAYLEDLHAQMEDLGIK